MNSRRLQRAIILALLSVAALAIGVYQATQRYERADNSTGPVTDVSQYSEILNSFDDSEITRHFPETLPPNVVVTRLWFMAPLFQGGTIFQLRTKQPSEQVETLYAQFIAEAEHLYRGDTNVHANLPDGVPTTRFYTSGDNNRSFPESYEVIVLEAQPAGGAEFEWNHGYSYGVAIDKTASEIVYWLEEC
jgi:hypothetical protein